MDDAQTRIFVESWRPLGARAAGRRHVSAGYSPAQRRALAEAARKGEPLRCPECGRELIRDAVRPRRDVSYVRRRLLLVCPGCRRAAAVDLTPG